MRAGQTEEGKKKKKKQTPETMSHTTTSATVMPNLPTAGPGPSSSIAG
jgi:hypothetical protein